MRKKALLVLLMMMVAGGVLLFAGGAQEESENVLTVVNWKDYGSDGEAVIRYFEETYGCKIVHEYMASEEELLTKLRTGGVGKFDVVLPNASILPMAIEEGLIQKIDTDALESFDQLFDRFKKIPENMKGGELYAVPWVWGSTGIAYNNEMITEEVDTINVLWDKKYAGNIAFRDDYNDAVMSAAIALGQDPNNPSDLEAIKEKLLEQKPLNRTYWKTGDEFSKLFANKQIAVGMMWSGQAASMKLNGEPISYVIPKEGAIGWVDNWAIVKDAPNKEMAYKFIDYMIGYEFQKDWVSSGGPAPVNQKVAGDLDPQFVKDNNLGEEAINKLYFIAYRDSETKKTWNELWQEVKAQ
jgi:spermidine/putrescine transport system substrate-binding protein